MGNYKNETSSKNYYAVVCAAQIQEPPNEENDSWMRKMRNFTYKTRPLRDRTALITL